MTPSVMAFPMASAVIVIFVSFYVPFVTLWKLSLLFYTVLFIFFDVSGQSIFFAPTYILKLEVF